MASKKRKGIAVVVVALLILLALISRKIILEAWAWHKDENGSQPLWMSLYVYFNHAIGGRAYVWRDVDGINKMIW